MTRYVRVAGIDPGATTGLVALLVPERETALPRERALDGARWIDSAQITSGSVKGLTDCETDARLGERIFEWLARVAPQSVAIEEPWDAVPQRLQARGTAFGLGKAYGLALAAVRRANARCMSYPVTSADQRMSRGMKRQRLIEARTGWMPTWRSNRGALMVQAREITLEALHVESYALRQRRADGRMLHDAAPGNACPHLSEDELMALGVLQFHLSRIPMRGCE